MSTRDAERLRAGLDEDERVVQHSGPAKVAWLTIRDGEGRMRYTTVAAGGEGDWDVWVADGREIPEPGPVNVVYDPAAKRRDIAARRHILALYEEFAAEAEQQGEVFSRGGPPVGGGIHGGASVLHEVVKALAAVYEEAEETVR